MNRPSQFGHTKIICTIGPSSQEPGILKEMISAGMDVARLNFSHGDHEGHRRTLERVRTAAAESGEAITILQDLGGPKIRTGVVENHAVSLEKGQQFVFTIDDVVGNAKRVSTTYKALPKDVRKGDTILVDDGRIKMIVTGKTSTDVSCEVVNGGVLKDKKGMNLPGVSVSVSSLTDKDRADLKFGLEHEVDYVALSFVRKPEDIRDLRKVIIQQGRKGVKVPIVAKIEKPEAVEAIDGIIEEADVIMVARGDLGVELQAEEVPLVQKRIVAKCNKAGKPVIIATQMLESMIENPRPTRAEANDVANAVLDGTDAVMLSGETSVGKYAVEAVHTMDRIIRKAETIARDRLGEGLEGIRYDDMFDAIARAAAVLAKQLGARAIVPVTHSGGTALRISKYRPPAPIVAVTGRERILRRMNLIWGVRGMIVPELDVDSDTAFKRIEDELVLRGYVRKGDYVVFTAGTPLMSKGSTNTIKVARVGDETGAIPSAPPA
ncbi:MAG: pyruvate kinase [Ignavibacterium sp.]|jgi:pyruvate kinase